VNAPTQPPFEPMLARLVRELPRDGFLYEPKWDGFRALVVGDVDGVEVWSRHGRPLARYFPELVEALEALPERALIVDGEILVRNAEGAFDFAALLSRLHPAASRVARLRRETPALFVAFDVVRIGDDDLHETPFVERRRRLERLFALVADPLALTPIADDAAEAERWLERFAGGGIDGVVAKRRDLPYLPGERVVLKVKREHTADCVVAGFRWLVDRPAIGSLLLGLYDGDRALRHVGVVSSFTEAARRTFLEELSPLAIPLAEHPWAEGFLIERSPLGRLKGAAGRWTPDMVFDWLPLRPERVAEVAYDRFDGDRFRHPARFLRWRPDRDPASCTFDQLEVDHRPPAELVATGSA
jgi:ATP-dependent DNA ligase